MKLKKLNARGIAHIIMPAVVVLAIGIIGAYFVVSSHASTYDARMSGYGGYSCKSTDTLRSGSRGDCVKALQYGIDNWVRQCKIATPILTIDGKFGASTTNGVKVFQSKHGIAADGIVGANTWNAFFAERSIYPNTPCGYTGK